MVKMPQSTLYEPIAMGNFPKLHPRARLRLLKAQGMIHRCSVERATFRRLAASLTDTTSPSVERVAGSNRPRFRLRRRSRTCIAVKTWP